MLDKLKGKNPRINNQWKKNEANQINFAIAELKQQQKKSAELRTAEIYKFPNNTHLSQ